MRRVLERTHRLHRLLFPVRMLNSASSAAPPPAAAAAAAAAAQQLPGCDADGKKFKSAEELWQQEKSKGLQQNWYGTAISYWSTVPATVDGVLGGYGRVHAPPPPHPPLPLRFMLLRVGAHRSPPWT